MAKKTGTRTAAVSDHPVIPYIEGDGTGPDIWRAANMVFDRAVQKAYDGKRYILWKEIFAGEKAFKENGDWLPEETLLAVKEHGVAIKGPLTTPVGQGIRSINVAIRQKLDLYANVRPIRYIESVPSPVKHPERVNMVVFRENTEDIYAGIEWEAGSDQAKKMISAIARESGHLLPDDSGIGIKPISEKSSKRLVAKAIAYAVDNQMPSVTLMHKGNIMKFTEGAFRKWGYEVAEEQFGDVVITEQELRDRYNGVRPEGKIIIKDRIADMLFQQVLLRPEEFSVIAAPNLNGDYISDAIAAQVGGLGMAPGANIGDTCAVFEAVHGTAPKYANLDKVNPGSLILSGAMMLDYIGWKEAAALIRKSLEATVKRKIVTYDLARQMEGATEVKCSGFAGAIVKMMS